MSATNTTSALAVLSHCSAAIRLWFLRNGLMLNADKSEVIILGTAPQLKSLTTVRTVDVAGSSLPASLHWLLIRQRIEYKIALIT